MTSMLTALATILAIGSAPVVMHLQTAPAAPAVETAAPAAPLTLTGAERSTVLRAAAAAMTQVKTAKGQFTQIAPDYSMTTGDFVIARPGRVKFEYDDPTPITIVSDGVTVAIQDSELETTDRVPLGATPLGVILDDSINFESDADIQSVRKANGIVSITLRDKSGEMDGTLSLLLEADDYDLIGWQTVDGAGGRTSVELTNVKTGVKVTGRDTRIVDLEDEDEDERR